MKKHLKTTLGRKLTAFYLILVAASFYFIHSAGYHFIYEKVEKESQETLLSACTTLLNSHFDQHAYTKATIRNLTTHFQMTSEVSDCRIMIMYEDGDIVLDTGNINAVDLKYDGDLSFLREKCMKDFTMNGYLEEPSLCIMLPLRKSSYTNGFLVFAQRNSFIHDRADYYFNLLMTAFYLIAGFLGLIFLVIYFFNFRPLRKLRNGVKDFSIAKKNTPIEIHTNDEYGELADALNILGDELSKFDEYQRKFISNISHDFRSPLTSIHGYVQAIADGVIPSENQEKYLNIILFETNRLTKLTTDLLDVNNFDRDNIFLEISTFDIHESIHKTIDSLEGTAGKKHIRFRFQKAVDAPLYVTADAGKIQQVLQNLIDNAVKFSHSNSSICITTRTRGDKVFVSIKDSGIGIPKEDLGKIWDRFYKTDLSRGKDKLGTGLGLSISKEIINAHKQTIDVVSTEGVGTKFVFTLPKA